MKRLSTILMVAALVLLAVPAFAGDRVLTNGIDLWMTRGDGTTFADFSKQTLPAGFFCESSEPFTGRVVLKGIPIAAGDGRNLGLTDTIIQRLDNATFNKRGVARTRIQMRAMQFESVAPIKTACGLFKLYVTLDGQQPITTMRIVRTSEKGGRFDAPIWVNVKLSFKPVGRISTEAIELRKALRFPPAPNSQWSDRGLEVTAEGFVKVDTDSDGVPDTYLPGTSNFAAGRSVQKYYDTATGCHVEDEGQHCPVVVSAQ